LRPRIFLLIAAALASAPAWAAPAWAAPAWAAPAFAAAPAARVEAHSADLLAVGLVQGDRMIIRLSRVIDNAPVRDAAVAVMLRGATYATVAEADGSYSLTAKDLTLPGDAAVGFEVTQAQQHESLKGILKGNADAREPDERGNARQMWWWALNFGVCAGFLVLWSRRKKSAQN
jgi:hypothetical protein